MCAWKESNSRDSKDSKKDSFLCFLFSLVWRFVARRCGAGRYLNQAMGLLRNVKTVTGARQNGVWSMMKKSGCLRGTAGENGVALGRADYANIAKCAQGHLRDEGKFTAGSVE
jgi:hypothetical protein